MSDAVTTRQEKSLLYDFYGGLLTEKQRTCFELHHMDDMSLAEIAADMNISPQAVSDVLKRSLKRMQDCDDELGLLKKFSEQQDCVKNIQMLTGAIDQISKNAPEITYLTDNIRKLLEKMLT